MYISILTGILSTHCPTNMTNRCLYASWPEFDQSNVYKLTDWNLINPLPNKYILPMYISILTGILSTNCPTNITNRCLYFLTRIWSTHRQTNMTNRCLYASWPEFDQPIVHLNMSYRCLYASWPKFDQPIVHKICLTDVCMHHWPEFDQIIVHKICLTDECMHPDRNLINPSDVCTRSP